LMSAPGSHFYSLDERSVDKDVVDKMFRDSHVRHCWELRCYSELAGGWTWEYEGIKDDNGKITTESEATGKKLIKHLEWQFDNVNKSLGYRRGMYDLLLLLNNPPKYGHTVFEPVWEYNPDYKQVVLTKYKPLPPDYDDFTSDEYGNLVGYKQTFGTTNDIPIEDVRVIVNKKDDEIWSNWYGESELRSMWRYWYIKDEMLKSWMDYLELKVVGKTVIKMPAELDAASKTQIDGFKTNITTRSVLTVQGPKYDAEGRKLDDGVTIDQVQMQDKGAEFGKAIAMCNSEISKMTFQPQGVMSMSDDAGTGSRATAEEHGKTFSVVIRAYQMQKEPTINDIGDEILVLNYRDELEADDDGNPIFPRFKMLMPSREDLLSLAQMIKLLIESGFEIPDSYIRERFNIPEPDLTDEDEEEPQPPTPPAPPPSPTGEEPDIDEDEEVPDNIGEAKLAEAIKAADMPDLQAKERYGHVKKVFTKGELTLKGKINDWLEQQVNRLINLADKVIPKADKGNEVLETEQIAEAAEAPTEQFDYNALLRGVTINDQAITELEGIFNNAAIDTAVSGANDGATLLGVAKVKPESAINWLKAQNTLNSKSMSAEVEKKVQQILVSGLGNGKTIDTMRSTIEGMYSDYIDSPTVKTIVRTNINKAYNQGRIDTYKQSKVVEGVVLDPVLDERTSEYCEGIGGQFIRMDDPNFDAEMPPRHFNCRTIATPVTRYDDVSALEPLEQGQVAEGFGGEA